MAHRGEDPRGKINSVPFVGVLVVPLFITFVVNPGFPAPNKAPLITLPGSAEHGSTRCYEPPTVELTITRDGRFWLDDGSELVPAKMEGAARTYLSDYVRIRADRDVPYGSVRTAMRELRRGGHKGLSLVVKDNRRTAVR
jgi:biopolymer transport protein ExbD